MTKFRNLSTLLLVLCATLLSAQNITVTGKISAKDESFLPGVNVGEKGTTSDGDGIYSIIVKPDAVLVFTFIGLQTTVIRSEEGKACKMFVEVLSLKQI